MAPEQNLRPQLPPVHTGGHRLRSHQSRGRAQDRPPEATDHPWQNPLQAQYPRPRVRALRHNVSDAQSGDAGPQRYIRRLSVAFVRDDASTKACHEYFSIIEHQTICQNY